MGTSFNSHPIPHIAYPKRHLLVLVGPTASGKTPISLLIAKHLPIEIVSAGSRQVYRYMPIGTAQPSQEDHKTVPHHFIDVVTPDTDFNAGEFGKQGREIIDDIFGRGKIPLVVGGSGLYIQALIDGFFDGPASDESIREELYSRLTSEGADVLYTELQTVDAVSADNMTSANTRRLIRALEVYKLTGVPISTLQQSNTKPNFSFCLAGREWERSVLYERINARVDRMLADGLLDEVRKLQELGYSPELNSLQTVGYKEAFSHLAGEISYERMVELIKQNSRRYAKRQMTWFRPDERIRWFNIEKGKDLNFIAGDIVNYYLGRE